MLSDIDHAVTSKISSYNGDLIYPIIVILYAHKSKSDT